MTRWRHQIRFVIIAVAGFVLLVTVLPEVASGIGLGGLANRLDATTTCSGSSGSSGSSGLSDSSGSCCSGSSGSSGTSGSSGCATGPGTVSGTVAVTGAPLGFSPGVLGAGACPYVAPGQPLCAFPQYGLTSSGAGYTLSLNPGTWILYAFYENALFGGAFLGSPHVVTIESGATVVVNATVPYAVPATLGVSVHVNGMPAGVTVTSSSVVLCPSNLPYDGVTVPLPCVQGGSGTYPPSPTPGSFVLTGLPAGKWTAYPGYCTDFGCVTNPAAGRPVTTVAGGSQRVYLTTPYLLPPEGRLTATVSVSGAPAGFNDPVGFMACQVTLYGSSCTGFSSFPGPATMFLGDGIWTVTAFYTVSPFGNAVTGQTTNVLIQGGRTTTVALDVPYQVLGTATGTIKITGLPTKVHPTGYSVYACPVGSGGQNPLSFLSCVSETSGTGGFFYGSADPKRLGKAAVQGSLPMAAGAKINTFTLPTLTAGLWDIQVSYTTPFGYFSPPNGTIVNIVPGTTTTAKVKVPYQVPATGIVKGSLTVVGIPGSSSSLVQACAAPPVAGVCTGEVDAYPASNGTYQLQLSPGSWWIQGVTYVYSGFSSQTLTSPTRQLSVAAGTQTKANFTVTGP